MRARAGRRAARAAGMACLAFAVAAAGAQQLLFDDFSSCQVGGKPNPALWQPMNKQWGGTDINGGVVPDNVQCATDSSLGKTVLKLTISGDLFNGSSPVGIKEDGTPRGPEDIFKGWAWGDYEPVGRGCAPHCDVRRVGGAVSSLQMFENGGVFEMRVLPCPQFGALTAMWTFNYTERYCNVAGGDKCDPVYTAHCCTSDPCTVGTDKCGGEYLDNQEIDFELPTAGDAVRANTANPFFIQFTNLRLSTYTALDSSKSAQCGKVTPCAEHDYEVLSFAQNDGNYHTYRLVWDVKTPSATFFVDGVQTAAVQGADVVPTVGRLYLGLWMPNAWAGTPAFDTCDMLVDYVNVTASP